MGLGFRASGPLWVWGLGVCVLGFRVEGFEENGCRAFGFGGLEFLYFFFGGGGGG